MRRWLNKHWLYVVALGIGLVLMPFAIHSAYAVRGYFAVGGEYFLIPLALLIAMLIDEIKVTAKEVNNDERARDK